MAASEYVSLYEQDAIQQALNGSLHPGGLALTGRALALCALPAGSRILDVGCGTGTAVRMLRARGYRASGVDLSARLLRGEPGLVPDWPCAQADGLHLPVASGSLDAVWTECSLSLLASVTLALAEFKRVLAQGGWLIASDLYARNPDGLALLKHLPLNCCLRSTFEKDALLTDLSGQGFQLRTWEDHSEVLRPLAGPLLSQALESPQAGTWDALDLQLAVAGARPGYFLLAAQKM